MAEEFYVGMRLSYDSNLCTVRYVGSVKGTTGTWLGVEWDVPTRGKHNGEHNGARYFRCSSKQNSAASFVRPSRPRDPSRTFLEALRLKYAGELEQSVDPEQQSTVSSTIRISGKDVEEVGFDKVRRRLADIAQLRNVLLDGMLIAGPDSPGHSNTGNEKLLHSRLLTENQPSLKIVELDLSRNLVESFAEIQEICRPLKKLRRLRIGYNRFYTPSRSHEHFTEDDALRRVHELNLNNTLLDWPTVSELTSTFFPDLTSLQVSENELRILQPGPVLQHLAMLDLSHNEFQSLSDLEPVALMQTLGFLSLKQNFISKISEFPGIKDSHSLVFPQSLVELDLSYNQISQWSFIDALSTIFPGLSSLRVAHNPLFQNLKRFDGKVLNADDGYALTIGRLGNLKSINFSNISEKDRLNADTYYLSQIAAELGGLDASQEALCVERHPRYKELCREYGQPVITRTSRSDSSNSLSRRFVQLHIRPSASALPNLSPESATQLTVQVPRSLPVFQVIGHVADVLRVDSLNTRLIWETGELEMAQDKRQDELEEWDSGDEQAETRSGTKHLESSPRELELLFSTHPLATIIDVEQANIRLEIQELRSID